MRSLLFIITLFLSSAAIGQTDLRGLWDTGEDNSQVEVFQENGQWKGVLKSSDNPKAKLGTPMLKNLEKKGDGWKGQIYSPKKKDWFDAFFIRENTQLKIKVTAGFMTKEVIWEIIL